MLFPTLFLPFLLSSKEATSQLGLLVTQALLHIFWGKCGKERCTWSLTLSKKILLKERLPPFSLLPY